LCTGDKLEALVASEAASQAAAASEVSQLKAQLAQAEAAAAAAEQQADSLSAQLVEAQQALIDADRQVCTSALPFLEGCGPVRQQMTSAAVVV
jgi:chromosome segregation ATPase